MEQKQTKEAAFWQPCPECGGRMQGDGRPRCGKCQRQKGTRGWSGSGSDGPLTVTRVDPAEVQSAPVFSEWEESELRSYRRDLALCRSDSCRCVCKCHSGGGCSIEERTARFHTRFHQPVRRLKVDPLTGVKVETWLECHDVTQMSAAHFRRAE